MLYFLSIFLLLFILELVYFKIADRFNIIDKPNHRSSHTSITLRGGGIIFGLATLLFFGFSGFQYPYFTLGLVLIAGVSFLDDVLTLDNKIRLTIHLTAALLMFHEWQLFSEPWYYLVIALLLVIGTINAYNFMDGVNGMTGAYSLLAIATLYYINEKVVAFTSSDLLLILGMSLLVFNFFNFRKKAKCFAGDVGSVSIAFAVVFLIGQLVLKTQNFTYILLLTFYGLDTVSTIVFRKIRGENIFEAHRSHFYQYLANQKKWNHLTVSGWYATIQLGINFLLLSYISTSWLLASAFLILATLLFLLIRLSTEGKQYLFAPHQAQ